MGFLVPFWLFTEPKGTSDEHRAISSCDCFELRELLGLSYRYFVVHNKRSSRLQ